MNFTQQYGKNLQRCQQNKFTILYGNYCYIFIENFPQKFSPCTCTHISSTRYLKYFVQLCDVHIELFVWVCLGLFGFGCDVHIELFVDLEMLCLRHQVSLDSRVREIVNRNMVEPTPHTFDEAQLQIYTLMHRDSYPRFVNSELYRKVARLSSDPPSPTNGEQQQSADQQHPSGLVKTKSKRSTT